MTLSRFDFGSTSVRSQKSWTSHFYGSMKNLGLKILENPTLLLGKSLANTEKKKKEVCVGIYLYINKR